ncbi:MAG: glycosyltransferase family 1 protein, partial [Vicingaceae bacterium]
VLFPPIKHASLGKIWFDHSVRRKLRQLKPDVFLSTDSMNTLHPEFKTATVIHDLNFEHFPEYFSPSWRNYYLNRVPVVARESDAIFTVSEFSAKDITRQYGIDSEKITVIYNGASTQFIPSSPNKFESVKKRFSDGKEYFLFVGGMYHRKNLLRLFKAFEQFKEKSGSETVLVMAGRHVSDSVEVISEIKKSRFRADIITPGRINDEDLPDLMSAARALTYVSVFEGFGMPVLEAMSCGIPILTSNGTSLPEIAGDAAYYADPFDVESICAGLVQLDSDPELRAKLAEKALTRAQLFKWDDGAEKAWTVLSKLIRF